MKLHTKLVESAHNPGTNYFTICLFTLIITKNLVKIFIDGCEIYWRINFFSCIRYKILITIINIENYLSNFFSWKFGSQLLHKKYLKWVIVSGQVKTVSTSTQSRKVENHRPTKLKITIKSILMQLLVRWE